MTSLKAYDAALAAIYGCERRSGPQENQQVERSVETAEDFVRRLQERNAALKAALDELDEPTIRQEARCG